MIWANTGKLRPTPKYIEVWNNRVPIGTAVTYQKDDGSVIETKTRSAAGMLGTHTAVIWLEAVNGCVRLDRVATI